MNWLRWLPENVSTYGGDIDSIIALIWYNNGQRFGWSKGDLFVVPTWAWHEHAGTPNQEAILFSVQDRPAIEALGLYREQAYEEHDGHQPISGVFEG